MKTDQNAPINPYRHLNCNGQIDDQYEGLTKREYFAAMAMQGLLSSSGPDHQHAKTAIEMADDLIKELNHE
jgi:hypothetical protein